MTRIVGVYTYTLNEEHEAIPEPDLRLWLAWMVNRAGRIVRQDTVNGCFISTIFLGLDMHGSRGSSDPLLFETAVFAADDSGIDALDRCSTWEQAIRQHERAVRVWDAPPALSASVHPTNGVPGSIVPVPAPHKKRPTGRAKTC